MVSSSASLNEPSINLHKQNPEQASSVIPALAEFNASLSSYFGLFVGMNTHTHNKSSTYIHIYK